MHKYNQNMKIIANFEDFLDNHINMKKIFVFPALLALFVACTLQEPGEETLMMSFRAVQESSNGDSEDLPDATRTYMQGTKVLWSASDCISVFGAGSTTGVTYSINAEDAGKAEAAFTGEAVGAAPYYALYPASSSAKLSGSTLSLKLPATQSFVEGGFAPGINPMVAATNGQTMQFKNLCGIISITLSGNATIKSVKLTSMSAEPLWGDATVDMNYDGEPVLVMKSAGDESHRSITLDCGNGVSLKRTGVEFRIVVPVGSLAGGFRILVTDANGGEMAKETTGHETMRACIAWRH